MKKASRSSIRTRMRKTERYTVYDPFAAVYDRHWGSMFFEDARQGIHDIFLPLLPPKGRLLDLCCGTGQMAHWLTGCGFRVTGLDGSSEMIRHARRNAPRAEFVVEDARTFDLPGQFDAVISVFDSLNHLPDHDGLFQVFSNVHKALSRDGLFFFDMNMDEGFRCSWNEMYSNVETDQVFVTRARYDPKAGVGKTLVTLFRPNGKDWRREDLEIAEYCYAEEVVRALLAKTGFGDVTVYDGAADLGMPRGDGRLFFLTAKGEMTKVPPHAAAGPS
jgi:SAM-dependent methyltransferase